MRKFLLSIVALLLSSQMCMAWAANINIQWQASTDNVGVAGYKVFRDGNLIGTVNGPGTSYLDTTAQPTTTYSYTVQAFDAAGNISSLSQPAVILTGMNHGTPGGDLPFTPLHTYFMSASGNDSNNGLTTSTAWATPNHSVQCGDVILVNPGTYSSAQFGRTFGTVSNCPSTTGGIDGAGGIYFAAIVCAGDLAACVISQNGSGNPETLIEWYNGQSNWAISGFNVPTGSCGGCRTFGIRVANDACNGGFKSHHIAVINTITSDSMQGFGFNDCGILGGSSSIGADYVATVGMIVQNSNRNGDFQGGICVGAIDFVGLTNWDTTAGTHAYIFNNYGINNQVAGCVSLYDGHAFYIDSPDVHGFSQQAVIANNIGYQSTRQCIALTYSGATSAAARIKINNNTCFNDMVGTGTNGDSSEFNLNTGQSTAPWTVLVTQNVSYVNHAFSTGGAALYAMGQWYLISSVTIGAVGGDGQENVIKADGHSACDNGGGNAPGPACDTGFNLLFNGSLVSSAIQSGNFFVTPSFTNTTDLLANRLGVPNCAGFDNTTQCMGWDARTGILTTPSVISDLTAGCGSNCTGKGFQRASMGCASNADYPLFLKGMNYLHADLGWVNGTTVTQRAGLATRPCGL